MDITAGSIIKLALHQRLAMLYHPCLTLSYRAVVSLLELGFAAECEGKASRTNNP